MASCDIVIVNWNAGGQLRRCLESVAGTVRAGCDVRRVVIVDNASSDGSADGLEYPSLPLMIIRNDLNEGFAAACNRGASKSGADYLLFLNPDMELFSDSLSRPVAFLEHPEHRRIGIAGIQLIDECGAVSRSCARFPSLARCVSRALGLHRLSPRLFPTYMMTGWDHGAEREVDHVSGAFFLVRRAVFETLGGFDERFFVYLEDLDFSYRMRLAGWRSRYIADARAFHRGGGVSEKARAERLYYSTSSRILYAFKHFTRIDAGVLLFVTVALEPLVRLCSAIVAGSTGDITVTARGYARLYRALPRITRGMRVHA